MDTQVGTFSTKGLSRWSARVGSRVNPLLLFMLCFLLCWSAWPVTHVCTRYTVCGCVSAGNMGSVSPLAEWGNMELEEIFLSEATGFSNYWQPTWSLHICPLPCRCQRHKGLPGTSLCLSISLLQGSPLHPLCTKAVTQKRSTSEEQKSENHIFLNTYISTACQTGLAFPCILSAPVGDDLLHFLMIFKFTSSYGFSELSCRNYCLMHFSVKQFVLCQLSLKVV